MTTYLARTAPAVFPAGAVHAQFATPALDTVVDCAAIRARYALRPPRPER